MPIEDGLTLAEQLILDCQLDRRDHIALVVLHNEDEIVDALQNMDAILMAHSVERSDLVSKLSAALEENTDLYAEVSKLKTELGTLKAEVKKAKQTVKSDNSLVYRVTFTEYERGWGQRREYGYYATKEAAEKAIKHCNSQNTAQSAPDWYMIAEKTPEAWARSDVPKTETIVE